MPSTYREFKGVTKEPITGKTVATYEIAHNNDTTTVRQDLLLTKFGDTWKANMLFDDIDSCDTATEAAHKLADWMERLALALREGNNFDSVNLNNLRT